MEKMKNIFGQPTIVEESVSEEVVKEMEVDTDEMNAPPLPCIPEHTHENENAEKLPKATSNIKIPTIPVLKNLLSSKTLTDSVRAECPFPMLRAHMVDSFVPYPQLFGVIMDKELEDETEERYACYANEFAKTYNRYQTNCNVRMFCGDAFSKTDIKLALMCHDASEYQKIEDEKASSYKENIKTILLPTLHNYIKSEPLIVCPPGAPELTPEIDERIRIELERGEDDVIANTPISNIAVKGKDLKDFLPGTWLSDTIVNFYMELIQTRSQRGDLNLKIYCFGAHFYPMLAKVEDSDYGELRKITGDENMFLNDLIFFPVCKSDHWRLVVANVKERVLHVYNSMETEKADEEITNEIQQFLLDEFRRKNDNEESSPWKLDFSILVPQQNKDDCGVFMLQFADYLSREIEFAFDQTNMLYFRRRMIYEVATSQLLSLP